MAQSIDAPDNNVVDTDEDVDSVVEADDEMTQDSNWTDDDASSERRAVDDDNDDDDDDNDSLLSEDDDDETKAIVVDVCKAQASSSLTQKIVAVLEFCGFPSD